MMNAVLSNPSHPKYGVATIPFPIPRDQYTYCMELLAALEIGDAVKADCKVEKMTDTLVRSIFPRSSRRSNSTLPRNAEKRCALSISRHLRKRSCASCAAASYPTA